MAYRVFQSMAGGLWCHPQKDNICMMRDDSGGRFATLPHLKGCSRPRFPPFSDTFSPLIIKLEPSKVCKTKYSYAFNSTYGIILNKKHV